MNCECLNWARIDGRLTNHHPNCDSFEEKRYLKISLDGGGSYVTEVSDLSYLAEEIKESSDCAKWVIEIVKMTQEEFEAIPEFTGH